MHTCYHGDAGPVDFHECLCGLDRNHTQAEYLEFCEAIGLTPLESEIA